MTPGHPLVIWMGALATLAVFSFLYRDNRLYRFAEHTLLGLGIGFGLAATVMDYLLPKWWTPLRTAWAAGDGSGIALGLVLATLGLMWYGLYHKRTVWLSRVVMGLTMGAGAGLAFKAEVNDKLPQLVASFKSPYVSAADATALNNTPNNIVFLVVLFSVLAYFFFSFEHRHTVVRSGAKLGRVFLMVTFGVFFGNTVMTRMSVFIERVWFLLTRWMGFGAA